MLSIATWNINSVRLRVPIVERFCAQHRPDVLCLQETKCQDSQFPADEFRRIGYEHLAIKGQKGYHGVCVAARRPFIDTTKRDFCDKGDARHVAVTLLFDQVAGRPITIHNFYVPAGGDEPDPQINPKFAHKLAFLDEMTAWMADAGVGKSNSVMVGDLNVAPLETDVWNHKALLKVVSHTPVEVERLGRVQASGPWRDVVRDRIDPSQRLYSWWSYRSPDWSTADKGRRLDHIWTSEDLAPLVADIRILREARGWTQPSDHAPVMATLRVPA